MLKRRINIKFLHASLKTFTNLRIFRKLHQILFWFSLSLIGHCSWLALEIMFRITGGYLKAEQASWLGLLKWFSQLVSDFIEASRNFMLDVFHKKQPKIVRTIPAAIKSTVFLFNSFTKNLFRNTFPVNLQLRITRRRKMKRYTLPSRILIF
jgi:hypothetical protein